MSGFLSVTMKFILLLPFCGNISFVDLNIYQLMFRIPLIAKKTGRKKEKINFLFCSFFPTHILEIK